MIAMLDEEEIWVDIMGCEGIYEVSNLAKVRNAKTGKVLKQSKNSSRYQMGNLRVIISQDGIRTQHFISHLVASHFVQNRNDWTAIYFKDGNRNHCQASNLRWKEGWQDRIIGRENLLVLYEKAYKDSWSQDKKLIYSYFKSNDRSHLNKLYKKYYPLWYRYLGRLTFREENNHDLCHDLLLIGYEGFIRAIDRGTFRFNRCRKEHAVSVYMTRILRNSYVNWKIERMKDEYEANAIIFSTTGGYGDRVRKAY